MSVNDSSGCFISKKVKLFQKGFFCGTLMNVRHYFRFFRSQKIFLKLHNIAVEPLMPQTKFNNVLTTFLGLEHVSCVAAYAGSESSQFSLS